jgi:hypothetical protein
MVFWPFSPKQKKNAQELTKRDVWLRWIEPNARVPGLIKLQIDLGENMYIHMLR